MASKLYDPEIDRVKGLMRRHADALDQLGRELLQLETKKHTALTTQRPWAKRHAA